MNEILYQEGDADTVAIGDGLPDGWTWSTIGEVMELNPAKPRRDALPEEAPVTFVPMPAVDAPSGSITAAEERPFHKVRKGYTAFRNDDVIFAKITPCMENGKIAIARGLTNGLGFGSTEFHVLRSSEAVIPEYLYHYLRQTTFRHAAEAEMTGSVGQKRVPADFVAGFPLPLPPRREQQRIVAQVERLLARVDAARERLANLPALLKRFRQAVLAAACSGRLTEDWRSTTRPVPDGHELVRQIGARRKALSATRGGRRIDYDAAGIPNPATWETPIEWAWIPLGQIVDGARAAAYGVLQPGEDIPDGVPFVRVCDLARGTVVPDCLRRIHPTVDARYPRTKLRGGELLVSLVGTIGRTALVPSSLIGANVARAIGVFPLCPEVNAAYVRLVLDHPAKNAELVESAREVARKTLNLGILKAIQVPIPGEGEQAEIVRRVDALFRLADAIERRAAAATAHADKLTQSILAKAFRGELVPTEAELARREGRTFESAAELLARIQAGRATAPARRRQRRPKSKMSNVSSGTVRKTP